MYSLLKGGRIAGPIGKGGRQCLLERRRLVKREMRQAGKQLRLHKFTTKAKVRSPKTGG